MRQHTFGTFDGHVATFDVASGEGTVTDNDGTWPFHCTQIANGARFIRVDTEVRFDIVAGLPGRWEATRIRSVGGSFLCPVCAAVVDGDEGTYEICGLCGWEDDPVQRDDPSMAKGANELSLDEARRLVR